MLASLTRVRVQAGPTEVLVIEDMTLPRVEWRSGGIDVYVAFGSPGTPTAMDAHLVPVPVGEREAHIEDTGERVATETATRRDARAQAWLGRPQMAGVLVRIKESQLSRAYAVADAAALRIRTLLQAPPVDASGARDVVVRLGAAGGNPFTLGQIEIAALDPRSRITRAEAKLCGPDAEPWPLTVAVVPPSGETSAPTSTLAPELAVRHESDDLCIRWVEARSSRK